MHTLSRAVVLVFSIIVFVNKIETVRSQAFEHVAINPPPPSGNGPSGGNGLRVVTAKVTTSTKWIQEAVRAHNDLRRLHGVPPLRLNQSLCEISQAWANHQAKTKTWQHNYQVVQKYKVGENLAKFSQFGRARAVNGSESVTLWYNEIKDYDFRSGRSRNGRAVGHFTQVMWRSTTSMGVALATRKEGRNNFVYIVANYYPAGNVAGHYQKNVPPPLRNGPVKYPPFG